MSAFIIRLLFVGLLILPSISPAKTPDNGLQELIGHAFDRKSGEMIYTEHHYQHFKDGEITRHHIEYKLPDGTALATKTLDYAKHPYAPDFRLQDWRDGYIEAGSHTSQGYKLERRMDQDSALKNKLLRLPQSQDLVADSGFDRYVKAKLPTLLETGSQSFDLALAGSLTSLSFEAKLVDRGELFGRPTANIKVQPASLLRLLTGGIDISYDLETGYLLRYEGISNIRDMNGERYDARIDFSPEDRKFTAFNATTNRKQPGIQRAAFNPGL